MKIDKISLSYMTTLILEMAKQAGPSSYSAIESKNGFRRTMYDQTKNLPVHAKVNDDIVVHKDESPTKVNYYTLDHNNKELLHMSLFVKNVTNKEIPSNYDEQNTIDRIKSDRLPKGYGADFTYSHFIASELPLKSSSEQFPHGHKMWSRLVDKALADGHHAYHYDENTGTHTEITPENKNELVSKSFGKSDDFTKKHLVLSKTPLINTVNESVYYRGTDNINEPDLIKSGQLKNSTNKLTAKEESGVSVSDVPDVKAHFKHMYKVTGNEVGTGSDGEPLLDPKSMKFVNWVNESTNDTHIDVDGVMKHRYNSEGKPIHSTDEGIRNFHRWFGDSDSVDEHGRPKVFHHGTPALSRSQTESTPLPFNEFKHSGSGVHSFSQDHDFAERYASTKSQDAEMDLAPFVFKTHLKTKTFDPNNEEHINAIRPHLGASVTHEGKYGWSSFGGTKQMPTEQFVEKLKGIHDIYRPLTKEMHEKAEVGKHMGLDGGTILVHHKTPTKLYYSEAYQIPGDLPHDKMEEVRAAARQEPEKPHSMKFTYQPFKEQPWVIRQKEMKIYNTTWVPGKQKGDNWEMTENDQFKEAAKKAGFNAVKQTERRKENVAVFDNTQIKSATHNTGAFAHPTKIDE